MISLGLMPMSLSHPEWENLFTYMHNLFMTMFFFLRLLRRLLFNVNVKKCLFFFKFTVHTSHYQQNSVLQIQISCIFFQHNIVFVWYDSKEICWPIFQTNTENMSINICMLLIKSCVWVGLCLCSLWECLVMSVFVVKQGVGSLAAWGYSSKECEMRE